MTDDSVADGTPIAYQALAAGTPVLSSTGTKFGTVHHVLQVESLDLFDGLSVRTDAGLRFVDRNQVDSISTTSVRTSLTDAEAAALPVPEGSEAFHDNVEKDQDQFLTARLGRLFRREHWTKDE